MIVIKSTPTVDLGLETIDFKLTNQSSVKVP